MREKLRELEREFERDRAFKKEHKRKKGHKREGARELDIIRERKSGRWRERESERKTGGGMRDRD